jgi:hypothetical protein
MVSRNPALALLHTSLFRFLPDAQRFSNAHFNHALVLALMTLGQP